MTNSSATAARQKRPDDKASATRAERREPRAELQAFSGAGCSDLSGGGLTHPVEIPTAEESDKNEYHERRKKDLAPGNNVPRWEQQQSNGRNKGGACEARTSPRENGSDTACAAPHQSEHRNKRRGVGGLWPSRPECDYPGKACCEKRARKQNCSQRLPLCFHVGSFSFGRRSTYDSA